MSPYVRNYFTCLFRLFLSIPFSYFLHQVTKTRLLEKFSAFGEICQITVHHEDLFAYIHFLHREDAERAMNNVSFSEDEGRNVKITWKYGPGHLYLKNLNTEMEDCDLREELARFGFGNIVSCMIAKDADGRSKGFGYVHFKKEEDASGEEE